MKTNHLGTKISVGEEVHKLLWCLQNSTLPHYLSQGKRRRTFWISFYWYLKHFTPSTSDIPEIYPNIEAQEENEWQDCSVSSMDVILTPFHKLTRNKNWMTMKNTLNVYKISSSLFSNELWLLKLFNLSCTACFISITCLFFVFIHFSLLVKFCNLKRYIVELNISFSLEYSYTF